ncbi:ribosomal RNA processing protein 36 homolog isoform X3 [Patagioenas fasciata]|uniref:ribosomal RNA processing protein 36 homolog isoform X3 n=1 Tax=Patagioenas fasciata TaxID=372321 RepID=UPI003A9A02A4
MTIFCSHCRRPLQAEMSCLLRSGKQVPSTPRPFRSTKSASKARRDQINVELQALRSLLPISAREKERLSYLHTMALVCLQLRGAQLFPPDLAPPAGLALGTELLSLLPGFLLVLSASGKLVYVSENVAQVLGLSVVRHALVSGLVPVLRAQHAAPADAGLWLQWALSSWCQRTAHWGWLSPPQQPSLNQVELLAQGDTVFDILDGQAHEDVRKQLLLAQEEPGREVTFVGEMHTSKAFRLQHGGNRAVAVHGRFAALGQPASSATTVFLALCTLVARLPTDGDAGSQDDLFQSTHILDMTFTDVTESVTYHLGYRREELIGQSWYSLLHPEDADLAAAQHRAVDQSDMSFEERLQVQSVMKTRVHKQVTNGKKTAKPTKATVKQQQSKKGPLEMSAKKPVPFLRQVISVTKKVHRDPRFDDLSGEYKPEIFMKTYSFLDSIKKQEKEMVQKQLKKCRNVEQKEKLQQLLNRMTQQEQAQKKQQKLRERELSLKRQQRELAKQGKKPFFLKKSEKRKLELAEKYAELKRSGKLESFLNKKRKRNAIKDKRRLPSQKNL